MPVKVKVKQTGRIRAPRLDNGQLTLIGHRMVATQKARWANGVDASGNTAKPLSKKYTFIKKKYRGVNRPIRDNQMTGVLVANFTLRKAIDNQIRAENTSRAGRAHANRAQGFDEMIGFSGPDQVDLFRSVQAEYGNWAKKAWFQINA
jgi:hypothetical protein